MTLIVVVNHCTCVHYRCIVKITETYDGMHATAELNSNRLRKGDAKIFDGDSGGFRYKRQ